MSNSSILATALSVTLAASCVQGPDYKRPETKDLPGKFTNIPAGWKATTPADHLDRGAWWKRLGDTQLNHWMTRVESSNPNIDAALARLDQARSSSYAARVALQPKLELIPRAASSRNSANTFRSPEAITQQGLTNDSFRTPLELTWEIDLWGRVKREREAIFATQESASAAYRATLLSLQSELAISWFGLRATDSEIDLVRQTLKLRKETKELLANRLAEGAGSELDISRAEAELAATESDLAALQARRAELVSGIALILGKPAQGFTLPHHPLSGDPPPIPLKLPSEVLERRPDIAQAERELAASSARIGVSRAALFPKIGLDATLGLASRDASSLLNSTSKTWSYGIDATVPLLRRTILKADVMRAEAKYDELHAIYRQAVLNALREVDLSLSSIKWLKIQQAAIQRQVAASAKASTLANSRYREGLTSLLEAIDAERIRLQAARTEIQLRNQRYASTIQLIKALGGSFVTPSK